MDNSASIYNTNDRGKRPTAEPHKHKPWNSDGSSTQVLHKPTHVSAQDISKIYADLLFLKEIYSLRPNNAHIDLLPVFNSDYIKDISVSDLHPDYKPYIELSDIGFSFRTKNVLKTMGLKTVGELMCTPKNQFIMQKNFNRKCFNEIEQTLKQLVFENLADSLPLKDTFSQPPNNATIDLLPVFNPQSIENISTSDLHPDFKPYTKLSDIVFSVRTKNVLNRTGLKTIGELMCTPKNKFMLQKNFGRKCFNEIYQIIKKLVFENLADSLPLNKIFSQPPNNATIDLLPVFNPQSIENISTSDLHPDFRPYIVKNQTFIRLFMGKGTYERGDKTSLVRCFRLLRLT